MIAAEEETRKALKETNQQIENIANYTQHLTNNLQAEEADNRKVFSTVLQGYLGIANKIIVLTRNIKKEEVLQSCRHHHISMSILKSVILRADLKKPQ